MSRFHYLLILFVILLIGTQSVSIAGVKSLEQDKLIYLDSIKAFSINSNDFEKMSMINVGKAVGGGIRYDSGFPNLNVTLRRDRANVYKSYLDIKWKKTLKTIVVNGRVDEIRWRPKSTSFIYVWDLGDTEGGDFVKCTFNYVNLNYSQGKLLVNNKIISTHEPYSGLAWSSDGKYYVNSIYSSLQIKEFDSGKTWISKTILIDDGKNKIIPDTPTQLGYFSWVEKDKKIIFLWKSHPYDDEPSGYLVVDVGQFNIR